jgi:hypothetical protein
MVTCLVDFCETIVIVSTNPASLNCVLFCVCSAVEVVTPRGVCVERRRCCVTPGGVCVEDRGRQQRV